MGQRHLCCRPGLLRMLFLTDRTGWCSDVYKFPFYYAQLFTAGGTFTAPDAGTYRVTGWGGGGAVAVAARQH